MADRIAHAEAELRAHQAELERHVAERTEQLHHLAHHDPLTQLPNRRKLAAHLASALARAGTQQRLALLFVDVDNFKSINDKIGRDRKSTRLNSSHLVISYAVFCLKTKNRIAMT